MPDPVEERTRALIAEACAHPERFVDSESEAPHYAEPRHRWQARAVVAALSKGGLQVTDLTEEEAKQFAHVLGVAVAAARGNLAVPVSGREFELMDRALRRLAEAGE